MRSILRRIDNNETLQEFVDYLIALLMLAGTVGIIGIGVMILAYIERAVF